MPIRESGQHEPITINNKDEGLDGHNRLRVCEKLSDITLITSLHSLHPPSQIFTG